MSRKRRFPEEVCPICERAYGKNRSKTRHHIFPRWWYRIGIVVIACSDCHQRQFHKKYPMVYGEIWTRYECVQNWVDFCKSKGKNAYVIYPELCNFESLSN